ncbi:MAG TPA: hypothetical protein PK926_07810 [Spirochaetota bacterium]|nr:hypothetical protein [Spirochaetota bacterium]HPI90286.1 hypothetical protein [Spirochaetota bacterium]HPR46376.1 hypothetical protein [Spirochaetota bacterium]
MAMNDLYQDFPGYKAGSLVEADRFIRHRFVEICSDVLARVNRCYDQSREKGKLKLASEIEQVKRRLAKLEREIEERELSYLPPFLKEGIASVDHEKLSDVDHAIYDVFQKCTRNLEGLTCHEQDMHIIDRFTSINSLLREIEGKCHERMKLLKMEKK